MHWLSKSQVRRALNRRPVQGLATGSRHRTGLQVNRAHHLDASREQTSRATVYDIDIVRSGGKHLHHLAQRLALVVVTWRPRI